MFLLKKIISSLLMPLSVGIIICLIGLLLFWFLNKPKLGGGLLTFGVFFIALTSLKPVSAWLIRPLESALDAELYAAGINQPVERDSHYDFIVILGGGSYNIPAAPAITQIGNASLRRLITGIQMYQRYPGSQLVFTGMRADNRSAPALMAEIAISLGVPKTSIIIDEASRDTKSHAINLSPMLGDKPFLLVTSPYHLIRAKKIFENQGTKPIPVNIWHPIEEERKFYRNVIPTAAASYQSETAFHEYLGIAWSKLNGQL